MATKYQQQPACTDESDRELLKRYQDGDETAFDELLKIHSGYITYWVNLALDQAPWAQRDDLRQEANWGFLKAVQKYDSRKGNFHAFARIRAWGKMFDSPEIRIVHKTLYDNHSEVMAAHERLMRKLERSPSLKELAEEAGLSIKQVETALKVIPFPSSLEESDGAVAPEHPDLSQLLGDAIAKLSPNEAKVIISHYRGDKLRDIALEMGKSENAVKQLHRRAKNKLKDIIRAKGISKDGT